MLKKQTGKIQEAWFCKIHGFARYKKQDARYKKNTMTNISNNKTNNKMQNTDKIFDLEQRTTEFAKRVIRLCRSLPKDPINNRLTGQTTGSAGSMGANYREANDALGKKDFMLRMKIARKESKETHHWLECIEEANPEFKSRMQELKQECLEIKNIFSAIINKVENKKKNNKKETESND